MNKHFSAAPRLLSIAFAALLTLGMLGGIDQLAQADAPSAQLAKVGSARA